MKISKALSAAVVAIGLFTVTPAYSADLVSIAKHYVGLSERGNRKVLRNMLGFDPVRTPWCGQFMTRVVQKAGLRVPAGGAKAFNWSRAGRPSKLRRGAIIVFKHSHVGVMTRMQGNRVCVISGNSGRGMVRESCYARSKIRSIRSL